MNRRSVLLLMTTLLASLAPSRLLAQDPRGGPPAAVPRSRAGPATRRPSRRPGNADDPEPPAADRDDTPPNLPTEPGHQWRNFAIAKYTGLPHKENRPQNSIVDWIFRRTGTTPWHDEKITVLAAGRSKIRCITTPRCSTRSPRSSSGSPTPRPTSSRSRSSSSSPPIPAGVMPSTGGST